MQNQAFLCSCQRKGKIDSEIRAMIFYSSLLLLNEEQRTLFHDQCSFESSLGAIFVSDVILCWHHQHHKHRETWSHDMVYIRRTFFSNLQSLTNIKVKPTTNKKFCLRKYCMLPYVKGLILNFKFTLSAMSLKLTNQICTQHKPLTGEV